ncbi:hypothetical protein ACIP4X_05255 [Streptomyces sp. NPDC088817]|uniref:hypothetical protein n=1 Tax=Streptomyces sp. NPDC088817 TaxID=3365907 RepID=UPI00380AE59D
MSFLAWFILFVCAWMARSAWGTRHLPMWRRGLPALLLVTGAAGIVLVDRYGPSSPTAWTARTACVLLVLTSWALSLWARRSRPVPSAAAG